MSTSKSIVDELMPISTLFKSNRMLLFPKLEKLFIHACFSLDVIFNMQESHFHGELIAFLLAQLKERYLGLVS